VVTGEVAPVFYSERAITGQSYTGNFSIDLSSANNFTGTLTGNVTQFTFANPPSGRAFGFTLSIANSGNFTITWPASVLWPGGTAPLARTVNGTDLFTFYTFNGGTTWYGFVIGFDLS
jgi:hypothetical protein